MNNQAKKTKLIVINVALFILVPLLIFVGYKAYTILSEYMRAAQEYREIQDVAIDEIRTDEKDEASIVVDFSKLEEIIPEVVGWIRFEEPKIINYPIVQGKDNKKYLSSTFEGTENGAGCIYMDADYYAKHPYFNIYTPNGEKNTYQIFAVTVVAASSDSYKKVYVNDEEYKNYIQMIQKLTRDMLKPGMTGREIDVPGRLYYEKHGLKDYIVCPFAHSIGLMEAESPFFGPNGDFVLVPGMTVMVDVSFFGHPDLHGGRIETGFVITENGCRPLSPKMCDYFMKDL